MHRKPSQTQRENIAFFRSLTENNLRSFLLMEAVNSPGQLQDKISKIHSAIDATGAFPQLVHQLNDLEKAINNLDSIVSSGSEHMAAEHAVEITQTVSALVDKTVEAVTSVIDVLVKKALNDSEKAVERVKAADPASTAEKIDIDDIKDKTIEDLIRLSFYKDGTDIFSSERKDAATTEKSILAKFTGALAVSDKILVLLRKLGADETEAPGVIMHFFKRYRPRPGDLGVLNKFSKSQGTWLKPKDFYANFMKLDVDSAIEVANQLRGLKPSTPSARPSPSSPAPSITSKMGSGNKAEKLKNILDTLGDDPGAAKAELWNKIRLIVPLATAPASDDELYDALIKAIDRMKAARKLEADLGLKLETRQRTTRRTRG